MPPPAEDDRPVDARPVEAEQQTEADQQAEDLSFEEAEAEWQRDLAANPRLDKFVTGPKESMKLFRLVKPVE